jgi:hypothetical protein
VVPAAGATATSAKTNPPPLSLHKRALRRTMKMKTLLLIILAFGLSSSAFAQQVGLQKSSSPVSSLLEKTSGLDFSMQSTLIAPPAAMLNSVSPKSQNTARSRLNDSQFPELPKRKHPLQVQ